MKKSFTLIETIVVIAVIALTLPVIFAIIFTLMREQVKIFRLTEVKRNGDYVINSMENTIRGNAIKILSNKPSSGGTEICINSSATGNSMYFLDTNNQWFEYAYSGVVVSSSSATQNSIPLISIKTLVCNFTLSCQNNSNYSAANVSMSFDICYDTTGGMNCNTSCSSTRPEEIATIHYQSIVKLRNY